MRVQSAAGSRLAAACVLLATSAASFASAASDDGLGTSLAWVRLEGAEECVSGRALATEVEKRLGRTVFVSPVVADVAVEGSIRRDAKGFSATLVLRDSTGEVHGRRTLHSDAPTCSVLSEQVALVLAVMIDPDASLFPADAGASPSTKLSSTKPSPTKSASEAPSPAASAPFVSGPRAAAAADAAGSARIAERWRFGGGASAVASLDLLPSFAAGVSAHVMVKPPRWPTLLSFVELWAPQHLDLPSGGAAEFKLMDAGAAVCPVLGASASVQYIACLGASFGTLSSVGRLQDTSVVERFWLDVRATARLTTPLAGGIKLGWGVGVVVPIRRDTFVYQDTSGEHAFFRPAPVAFVGDLGLVLDFF